MDMPDMPEQTQEAIHVASMDFLLHQKASFQPQTVFEISKIKNLCNLIGPEHFQLELKSKIFHRHAVFMHPKRHLWCII